MTRPYRKRTQDERLQAKLLLAEIMARRLGRLDIKAQAISDKAARIRNRLQSLRNRIQKDQEAIHVS